MKDSNDYDSKRINNHFEKRFIKDFDGRKRIFFKDVDGNLQAVLVYRNVSSRHAELHSVFPRFEGQSPSKVNSKKVRAMLNGTPVYIWAKYRNRSALSYDLLVKVCKKYDADCCSETPRDQLTLRSVPVRHFENTFVVTPNGKCTRNFLVMDFDPDKDLGKYSKRDKGVAIFFNRADGSEFYTTVGPGQDPLLMLVTHLVANLVRESRKVKKEAGACAGACAVGCLLGAISSGDHARVYPI